MKRRGIKMAKKINNEIKDMEISNGIQQREFSTDFISVCPSELSCHKKQFHPFLLYKNRLYRLCYTKWMND